jgi:hypothetical protein
LSQLCRIEISVALHFTIYFRVVCDRTESFRFTHQKMRQIDIFRKVIRHMLNSTVFPKPYTHTPTHTGISQRRAPQIIDSTKSNTQNVQSPISIEEQLVNQRKLLLLQGDHVGVNLTK